MKRCFSIILLCIFVILSFSSCSSPFTSAENLIHPPKMTGLEGKLQTAFETSVEEKGEIVLKSPLNGEYRSAYTLYDLDSDMISEAVVFYTVAGEDLMVYMNILKYYDNDWHSLTDTVCDGTDIYSLQFADFNNDGYFDILASFSMLDSKSNKNLCIYSPVDNGYELNCSKFFTEFTVVDIDNDGNNEIVICYLNSTAENYTSDLSILKYDYGKIIEFKKTELYSENGGFLSVKSDRRNNITYLYIDETVGTSSVTEIIYYDNNTDELVKPINFDITNFSKCPTSRSISIVCDDIDNDGFIEIPVTKSILKDNTDSAFKNSISLIKWYCYVNDSFILKKEYINNSAVGFNIETENVIIENIVAVFDENNKITTFYNLQNEKLFDIYSVVNTETANVGLYIKTGNIYSYYCYIYAKGYEMNIDYDVIAKGLQISDNN